ncbi:MAG: methyltransferase domain-containing protein [bacterium]
MESILKEAQALAASGRLEEAGSLLERKAAEHPDSSELLAHLGYFHYSRGCYGRALEAYSRYIQIARPDAGICEILADIHLHRRDYASARHWLRQARDRGSRQGHHGFRVYYTFLQESLSALVRFIQSSSRSSGIVGKTVWMTVLGIKSLLSSTAILPVRWLERLFPDWACPEKGESDFRLSDFLAFLKRYDTNFSRESLAYHKIREVILASRHIPFQAHQAKILDIGTGLNPLPLYWSSQGAQVLVLDGSTYSFAHLKEVEVYAITESKSTRCDYLAGDARALPFASNSLDAVTALCVIEHIPGSGDIDCLRDIHRVLRPGGIAVVTVETSSQYEENWLEVPYPIGYQTNPGGPPAQGRGWHEVFCRNYSPGQVRKRLLESADWLVVDSGYYDDRRLPIRRWLDPARHSPLAFLLRPWQPLLSLLFFRPAGKGDNLTPSSIGYVVLRKSGI